MIQIRLGSQEHGPYSTVRATDRPNVFRFYRKDVRVEYFVSPEEQTFRFWWHCEERSQIPQRFRRDVDDLDTRVRNQATDGKKVDLVDCVVRVLPACSVSDLLDLLV